MEAGRKPLAKVEGRRRLRFSGLTVAWCGTRNLDDWVASIVTSKSTKLLLADRASERKVKTLLSRVRRMSKRQIEKLAKGSRVEVERREPPSAPYLLLPPSLARRLSAMHRCG